MEKIETVKGSLAGEEERRDDIQEKAVQNVPPVPSWDGVEMYLYEGFWWPEIIRESLKSFQEHFKARDSDILVASVPKAGTTWLKALTFSIVNRASYSVKESPLLTNNPHDLILFLEGEIYMESSPIKDLESLPSPRMFSTHTPYSSLPSSIKSSNCKLVYMSRNPLDQCVSYWHFNAKMVPYWDSVGLGQNKPPASLDELFNLFSQGISPCGPILDHMLGYWNASIERPDKVLFLKYEDMKEDIIFQAKRLAEFLGFPFSPEEEKQGLIEEITNLCSFKNMTNLEVNKTGIRYDLIEKNSFFRKGQVGDWANYLTPSMVEPMIKLMEEKFAGTGLKFQM